MIALNNFSFLTKALGNLTEQFRMFVVGSIVGIYGLVLYEVFPELLFELNNSVFYFIIPTSIITSILVILPKLAAKDTAITKPQMAVTDANLLDEIITDGTQVTQSETQENIDVSKIGGASAELDALLTGDSSTITSETTPVVANTMDENKIYELIEQKFEPIEKDLTTFKKDLNKIKEDMKSTKESVNILTESFEGTLTDMKAFQTEISNPLNFMRKYFESLDLSNLSDPSLPLRQGFLLTQNNQTQNNQSNSASNPQTQNSPIPIAIGAPGNDIQTTPPKNASTINSHTGVIKGSEMDNLIKGADFANTMDSVMKPLFSGSLSVANMMAIFELVGEMLEEKGDDCIDLLVEQCKLMGLKPEDESTIYNIIDMLKTSSMSVDQLISQLYRFAKIVGLNDKEADAYYARLAAQRSRRNNRSD